MVKCILILKCSFWLVYDKTFSHHARPKQRRVITVLLLQLFISPQRPSRQLGVFKRSIRSVLCERTAARNMCMIVSVARVFCCEGSGVENALWINANRADNSFSESRRSSNPRDGCEATGVGVGGRCVGGLEKGTSANQSFARTKTYLLLKVLLNISVFVCCCCFCFLSHIWVSPCVGFVGWVLLISSDKLENHRCCGNLVPAHDPDDPSGFYGCTKAHLTPFGRLTRDNRK